jgi:hypothetical protein
LFSMNPSTIARIRTTALWWAAYVTIGIVLVSILVYAAFHSRQPWPTRNHGWIQAGFLSTVCFGYLLRWGWKYKTNAKFWVLYLCLLGVHCGICGVAFGHGVRFSILVLAMSVTIEFIAMAFFIALMVGEPL